MSLSHFFMPGRNYTGGGSSYYQSGAFAGNLGPFVDPVDYLTLQRRDARELRERTVKSYLAEDGNYPSFRAQLARVGLQLRDIPADGNCLFRALGDQLEGHCRNHYRHRTDVVGYMKTHRHDFEPFVEDDVTFDEHVKALQKLGTHAGNDAIVAFAKLHNVHIIIHQLHGRPLLIQGPATRSDKVRELHLAYHNGDHYSSVRRMEDSTESPANLRLQDILSLTNHIQDNLKDNHRDRHRGDQKDNHRDVCSRGDQKDNPRDVCSRGVGEERGVVGVVSAKRGLVDIERHVSAVTGCREMSRVRQTLLACEYDVEASITRLLQDLNLCHAKSRDETTSLTSQDTCTTDSGISQSLSSCPDWSNQAFHDQHHDYYDHNHHTGNTSNTSSLGSSLLKNKGHSYTNGKGHKVHFRDDSVGSSSGYESLSSVKGKELMKPTKAASQSSSSRTLKFFRKGDKKKSEDKKKQPDTPVNPVKGYVPQAEGVRDVAVVNVRSESSTRL